MATTSPRALRATGQNRGLPVKTRLIRAATSPAAKMVYVACGAAGLAALAVAIMGPKRVRRQILGPARHVFADQAERLWVDSRPLRDQLGRMFDQMQSESGREKLVKSFQSWVGHFRAT